jgi:ribonuclease HII
LGLLSFERELWSKGVAIVAGVDEAGRGPLAGPVVASAVIFDPSFAESEETGILAGLTDSKQLPESRREFFYGVLVESPRVTFGLGSADVEEIDRLNILRATHLAMGRAVLALARAPEHILVDGLFVEGFPCASTPIVGGDALSLSIAAASVLAKVTRDRKMKELDALYPQYGFARHKGYGSSDHVQALFEYGPCPIHRRSFRPVSEAAEILRLRREAKAQEASSGGGGRAEGDRDA